jgi:N-glycosylase/DNA lyase
LEFTVAFVSPFSLEYTLESGQLFRWERRGEWWYGVAGQWGLKVKQEGEVLRCSSSSDLADSGFVTRYFRLDEDLNHVLATISKDRVITSAVQKFYGLRLVRQDTWECLASFVLATNANIPRIRKMVAAVCERYGKVSEFEGEPIHEFPSPEVLAGSSAADLRRCGLGYRAPFLKKVAASVAQGRIDFARIVSLGYEEARKELLSELSGEKLLLGVGPKVADCVLLFSCGKDEAFPIDVWIARALVRSYPRLLGPSTRSRLIRDDKLRLSQRDYERISGAARRRFGKYAGYAQQYLYMAAREAGT